MSECDAFKLIEEFIKQSSPSPSASYKHYINLTLNSQNHTSNYDNLPPTLLSITTSDSSTSSASSFLSGMIPIEKQIPETPEQINLPQNEQSDQLSNSFSRPNRPYSYYVATNFHPLDLSVLSTNLENTCLNETHEKTLTQPKPVQRRVKKSKKTDDTKRLSMSLGDIKITPEKPHKSNKTIGLFKFNSKKSKSNQNNLHLHEEEEEEPSSFKRSTFLTSTMPARIKQQTTLTETPVSSGNKLNKFFRALFRLKAPKQEEEETNSKFSRLFSFRHSSNQSLNRNVKYKYSVATQEATRDVSDGTSNRTTSISTNSTTGANFQLIVTDEQPSKILLPQISLDNSVTTPQQEGRANSPESYCKMNSLDSLDLLKEKFYTEVAERLKKLASNSASYTPSSTLSNEKSSLSSIDLIDIPYIDDEYNEDSEENLCSTYATNSNAEFNFSNCSKLKSDMSELVVDQAKLNSFIQNASYSKFDEIAVEYLRKYESIWYKIAILFELINRAVQRVQQAASGGGEESTCMILKLKEIAANYIHDKYCDWIYQNGGWKSVPDIISLPSENNERIL